MQKKLNCTIYRFERDGIGPFRFPEETIENESEKESLMNFRNTYRENLVYPPSPTEEIFFDEYEDKEIVKENWKNLLYAVESDKLELWFYSALFTYLIDAGFILYEIKVKAAWVTYEQAVFFERDIISKDVI